MSIVEYGEAFPTDMMQISFFHLSSTRRITAEQPHNHTHSASGESGSGGGQRQSGAKREARWWWFGRVVPHISFLSTAAAAVVASGAVVADRGER